MTRSGWIPSDAEKAKLFRFIGYGVRDPKVVFIGIEEAGGGIENLKIRAKKYASDIVDLKLAHGLFPPEVVAPIFGTGKHPVRVWNMSARLVLRFKGKDWRKGWHGYVDKHLGRSHGETLLADLYPLPKPSVNSWGNYQRLFPEFKNLHDYRSKSLGFRIQLLRNFIKEAQPAIVTCYGTSQWPNYQAVVDPVPSYYTSEVATWHDVEVPGGGPIRIGRTTQGALVGLTGFFGVSRDQFTQAQIDGLTEALFELKQNI